MLPGAALQLVQDYCWFPIRDHYRQHRTAIGAVVGDLWGLEGTKSKSQRSTSRSIRIAVTAQTKKLKAKWTPELGQDLNAYHNLDAEVELTSILSEQIALEIDREILADLVNGATAGTATGRVLQVSLLTARLVRSLVQLLLLLTSLVPFLSGTRHLLRPSTMFLLKFTARLFVVVLTSSSADLRSPTSLSSLLDSALPSLTTTRLVLSVQSNVGSLSKKFDVIVDPYFLRNVILVGRRGNSFLESGYVYAPYVPLQTTPTIFGPEDFVPRKGVMTRYAKKMVRPDMYGLVICRGLLGESGSDLT